MPREGKEESKAWYVKVKDVLMDKGRESNRRAVKRISIAWNNFKFRTKDTYRFLKWHFKNMFEENMTSTFKEICMEFNYDRITFRPFKYRLQYMVSCWREYKRVLWFYCEHLQDLDVVGQQLYVLSKAKETRDEHEGLMKLGSDLDHQELGIVIK